jgi:superfamily I DNA/RNA helicase
MPGFQDGLLPLEGADPREERNLAFVGMTRARDRLVLTSSRSSASSPFMAGMSLAHAEWP